MTAALPPVKKYPTKLRVTCRACDRSKTVAVMLDDVDKLTCKCGCRDLLIAERTPFNDRSAMIKGPRRLRPGVKGLQRHRKGAKRTPTRT
jgi:hypothetical protein